MNNVDKEQLDTFLKRLETTLTKNGKGRRFAKTTRRDEMKIETVVYSIQELDKDLGTDLLSIEKYQSDIYLFIVSDIKRVHDGEAKFYIADTIMPNVINVKEAKDLNELHSFHYGLSTPIIILDEDQNVIKRYIVTEWTLEAY